MDKKIDKYKMDVQKDFEENKLPLLVATKAFGMGIDKPNIRYTIHYGISGSLDSLYHEAGRAGRDRKESEKTEQINNVSMQSIANTIADKRFFIKML